MKCAYCEKEITGAYRTMNVFGPVICCSGLCECALSDLLDGCDEPDVKIWVEEVMMAGPERYRQECLQRGIKP